VSLDDAIGAWLLLGFATPFSMILATLIVDRLAARRQKEETSS
jgi:hypothetical protein